MDRLDIITINFWQVLSAHSIINPNSFLKIDIEECKDFPDAWEPAKVLHLSFSANCDSNNKKKELEDLSHAFVVSYIQESKQDFIPYVSINFGDLFPAIKTDKQKGECLARQGE